MTTTPNRDNVSAAKQRRDGTYAVRGHARREKRELGYITPCCSCGHRTFPCPGWREAVDALNEAIDALSDRLAT